MKQVKGRLQMFDWDCGPAAAGTSLELIGHNAASVNMMLASLPCGERGTSPCTMEAFVRAVGCKTQSGEMTISDLGHHTRQGRPVMALIQSDGEGHWVSVCHADSRKITYYCPVFGITKTGTRTFGKLWWDWDRRGVSYPGFGIALWREQE